MKASSFSGKKAAPKDKAPAASSAASSVIKSSSKDVDVEFAAR
jgi:hypothetical protein